MLPTIVFVALAVGIAVWFSIDEPSKVDRVIPTGIAVVGSGLLTWLLCWALIRNRTTDYEYWSGYVTTVNYREGWTEIRVVTSTDSKGNVSVRTETVNHPPEWWVNDTNGDSTDIEESEYIRIAGVFGVSNPRTGGWGGSKYSYSHDGRPETAVPWTTIHRFRNPTLVGGSLFSFKEFTKQEIADDLLPTWKSMQWCPVHGGDDVFADRLMRLNADVGKKCKIRIHVVFAPAGQPVEWAHTLEEYWKRGKKNEVTVVVGLDNKTVSWCYTFGWSKAESVKAEIADVVRSMDTFDGNKFIDEMRRLAESWEVADFKEYSYIQARVPLWFTLLLVSLGVGVVMVVFHHESIKPKCGF